MSWQHVEAALRPIAGQDGGTAGLALDYALSTWGPEAAALILRSRLLGICSQLGIPPAEFIGSDDLDSWHRALEMLMPMTTWEHIAREAV